MGTIYVCVCIYKPHKLLHRIDKWFANEIINYCHLKLGEIDTSRSTGMLFDHFRYRCHDQALELVLSTAVRV